MAANRLSTASSIVRSSSAQHSPTIRNSSRPSTTVADGHAENDSTSADIGAVAEYVRALKLTVGALGCTLESLGEQAAGIVDAGATLILERQVNALRGQFEKKQTAQEDRMQGAQKLLRDEVKGQVRGRLAEEANAIVKEVVQREIAQRVRDQQLTAQIPPELQEEVRRSRLEVLLVRIRLHNSEARRQNALIRSSSLHEPLHPLLPLLDTVHGQNMQLIEAPKASPLFPRDMTSLIKLSMDSLKALLDNYGLRKSDSSGNGVSREKYLNEFMSFIGVGYFCAYECSLSDIPVL
ncbi:hypothetical protein OBBRIDRAFT_727680 [Obba rivulosa]|uniref:Uncharacterized protein n=1 Tax=Obba rivulosa TaxID=1052685 RepID=A0A8E2DN42_9APHY|nr:hypothetical protein OBBRIDRAFT_727680 [Obba rivulosa]